MEKPHPGPSEIWSGDRVSVGPPRVFANVETINGTVITYGKTVRHASRNRLHRNSAQRIRLTRWYRP